MAKPSIDLPTAKAHLRVAHSEDDELIAAYAEAAVDAALQHIGLAGCLGPREIPTRFRCSRLPFPVQDTGAVLVRVSDDSGETYGATLAAEDFEVRGNAERGFEVEIVEEEYQHSGFYRIDYEAGFQPVPQVFRIACLFLLTHYYENRSAVVIGQGVVVAEMPLAVANLLDPWKRVLFA